MFKKLLEKLQNIFRQDEVYKMNRSDAEKTLAHVFEATGKKPNQQPLEKLAVRKKLPSQPYTHGIVLAAVALGFTLLAPLAFLPHRIPMAVSADSAQGLTVRRNFTDRDLLCLELSFGDLDLSATYLQTTDGIIQHPVRFDPGRNELILPCPDPVENANIYIYTTGGELLHILLSPAS